jgi:hypothetical protein
MCVAGVRATRNAHKIFARRDIQKAYEAEMCLENLGVTFTTCVERGILGRVREDDITTDCDGPSCEDMLIRSVNKIRTHGVAWRRIQLSNS